MGNVVQCLEYFFGKSTSNGQDVMKQRPSTGVGSTGYSPSQEMGECGPTKYRSPPQWHPGPVGSPEDPLLAYAVHAGKVREGVSAFVGRACWEGHPVPGLVVPSEGCYVCDEGEVRLAEEYELLINHDEAELSWKWTSGTELPSGIVQGGHTYDEVPLYIGRHLHNGSAVVGRVDPTNGMLYVNAFGEGELEYDNYEILVCTKLSF